MDFTPEDMEALQTCLEGIDRNVPVAVEPAAAKLLMPNTVRTVARHPCPRGMAGRTAPARGGTLAACRRGQDRADTLTAAGVARPTSMPHSARRSSGCLRIFGGRAVRCGPANSFQPCPITLRADKNERCPLLPNLLPNCLG